MSKSRIIVSLDFPSAGKALELVNQLDPAKCRVKVGKELFTTSGPALLEKLVERDFDVFLDLKYHDIPNTVAKACTAAADLGVWMLNVHACGGRKMLEGARDAIDRSQHQPVLIAVTMLTSLSYSDLGEIGIEGSTEDYVLRLAGLSQASGLDGVVCSAHEASMLRQVTGPDFILVTPGIRLPDSAQDDQRRVMTPAAAISAGSSFLVIGRPVTQAQDPLDVLQKIESEIDSLDTH